jgi:hypothetical protein
MHHFKYRLVILIMPLFAPSFNYEQAHYPFLSAYLNILKKHTHAF